MSTPRFRNHTFTNFVFRPQEPDLIKIAQQWNRIAEILPHTGQPSPPAVFDHAIDFRAQHAKDSQYTQEWAEHFWSQPDEPTSSENLPQNS